MDDGFNIGSFLFGNELRAALSTVTRKTGKGDFGLGFDLDILKVANDGPEAKVHDVKVDHSLPTEEPVRDPQICMDTRRLQLTKDGRILRYTMFFTGKPAHSHGRYQSRRLRVRKKKIGRQVVYQEDSAEAVQKGLSLRVYKDGPAGNTANTGHSLIQQISGNHGKKGQSSRGRVLAESFECRVPITDTFLRHPAALQNVPDRPSNFHPIGLIEWEDNIAWDTVSKSQSGVPSLFADAVAMNGPGNRLTGPMSGSGSMTTSRPPTPSHLHAARQGSMGSNSRTMTPMAPTVAPKSIAGRIVNLEFASGKWDEQIFWDDSVLPSSVPPTHLQLNLNDPLLIFETVDMSSFTEKLIKTEKLIQKRLKRLRFGTTSDGKSLVLVKFDKPVADRFNLSNDKQYDLPPKDSAPSSKNQKSLASSRLVVSSRVGVQHTVPALKLSMPFYKTFWTKNELRAWHRPKLDVASLVNKAICFEKLAKSKEGRKSAAGIISNSKKISLRERNSEFTLVEYSEEFPLLMMNVGMATFLLHFYRKQQIKESPVLENTFGIPRILEPNESSPFWIFGDIRPGETLPVIQNNLFRAPLFEHSAASTDFLGLKFNIKGKTVSKWFIRELPVNIQTVGQVFPTMEVFGPHSRKHNVFCRSRIQSFAYRLFRKDANSELPRLKISRIMAAFPQFSEGSLRKWLKDYADSVRSGHDSGTWRQRPDAPHLNEDDIRALVTPEMVCQYESMLAGQQRLNDAGYMDLPEAEGDEHEAIDNESSEVRLAPWSLSSNFISATLGKCTLQLRSLGDPTGRGEGFSFVKVVTKMIPPVLRNPMVIDSSQDSVSALKGSRMNGEQVQYRQEIVKIWDAQTRALRDTNVLPEETVEHEDATGASDDAASTGSRPSGKYMEKKLVIRRTVKNPSTGIDEEQIETITDQRLISAYINQRRVWERKRRRREIAAAASAARAKKARPEGQTPKAPKPRPVGAKPKKIVQVKCGTCGEIGHMRTNRICPRYSEYENGSKRAEVSGEMYQTAGRMDSVKISFSKTLLESAAAAPVPPIKLKISSIPPIGSPSVSTQLTSTLNTLMSDPEAWPFNKPVKRAEYPAYFQIISSPMDFGTIKSRIAQHFYSNQATFLDDVRLVRDNCILFNGPDHPFSKTVTRLASMAENLLQAEPNLDKPKDAVNSSPADDQGELVVDDS
ncbi:Transcription initiation factor TFIID subunit 1 domain-containing protein [Paramicrosporidium saccamoebae]|uniref:Transcription initiation factor TFIID subunit 1 domain-containing protein n=1 Tax=Paramicrosporidium saccamoebae TaxID=1246581 RepID=A0A2H9TQS5_9FUNG|nr:Transcription initiation factor TFIID subunit 1 domain-containing protein [Paramicrosporidium saccamoebae]